MMIVLMYSYIFSNCFCFYHNHTGTVANELVFTNQSPLQPDRRNSVNVAELSSPYSRHRRHTAKSNTLSGRK